MDEKYIQYHSSEFIESDPIQIPHLFTKKQDIEISAFLTATIAWGQRKSIIKNALNALNKNNNEPTMNNTTPTVAYSINAGRNKVLPKKKAHADMIFTNALTLGANVNFITIPYSVNSGVK